MWICLSPVGWLSGCWQWFVALAVLLGLTGCATPAFKGLPAEFGQAASQITTSISDQAVWEKISANLDGSVIEPGFEGYAGVLYVAGGRIAGFSGHVGASAIGEGSGELTPAARSAILEELGRDERYRAFLLQLMEKAKVPTDAPTATIPDDVPENGPLPGEGTS